VDISNVALDGLHRAELKLEKAATRITVDLSAEMVAVMSAKSEFSANLKSLETAGEEQKSLIDLTVHHRLGLVDDDAVPKVAIVIGAELRVRERR
jgi:hypothetical protein